MWNDVWVVILCFCPARALLRPRRQHPHVQGLVLQVPFELVVGCAAVASRSPFAHFHHDHHDQRRENEGEDDADEDA